MNKQEDHDVDYREVIRQRRITAGVLLALALASFLAINGGELEPFGGLFNDDTGVYAAGDPYGEWIYAECDGEQQQITVLKNGQLLGVSGLETVQTISLPNWCDLPLVDNQNLGLWEAKLAHLNEVTGDPKASAITVLDAALDLPLSSLYLQPVSRWLESGTDNGAALLDAIAMRGELQQGSDNRFSATSRRNLETIVNQATQQAMQGSVDTDRVRSWLVSQHINSNTDVILSLAHSANRDPEISVALLDLLESVPQSSRTEVYQLLGEQLVAIPEFAPLLADQLSSLSSSQRLPAARALLLRPDASVEYAKQLLTDLDDNLYGEQAELDAFTLLAGILRQEADAPYLLSNALDDLADMERRMAAIHMLEMDRDGEPNFTLAVLDVFDGLHELSQPRVVTAILQSPQFDNQQVQQRLVDVIATEVDGVGKQELLDNLESHPRATAETIAAARAAMRED